MRFPFGADVLSQESSQSHRRSIRACTIGLALACILGAFGWLWHGFLLSRMASFWIVSDPIVRADAIVVLGGNFHVRPQVAAALYRGGFADKVLISRTLGFGGLLTAGGSDEELNRNALINLGVPSEAIETFGTGNASTRDEAVALKRWAQPNREMVFIIPSETASARRVQWIFRRELSEARIHVRVSSFEPPGYPLRKWWETEQGRFVFLSEVAKYGYYRIIY